MQGIGKSGVMLFLLMAPTGLLALTGCRGWHSSQKLSWERDEQIDQLWLAGYGYNNPNPDHRRRGEPLEHFDGRTTDEPIHQQILSGMVSGFFQAIFSD